MDAFDVADWRQRVFGLYAGVRSLAADDPRAAHEAWRTGRDELFASHPASPLLPEDRAGFSGLAVAAYDPALRFETTLRPHRREPEPWSFETGTDGTVTFDRLGTVDLDGVGELAVWRLTSYGGGIFVPLKDASAGTPGGSYGGGRYLLDTVKGADLGGAADALVIDLNFAYNPSCAYDPAWACPLAPTANTVGVAVLAGELTSPSRRW